MGFVVRRRIDQGLGCGRFGQVVFVRVGRRLLYWIALSRACGDIFSSCSWTRAAILLAVLGMRRKAGLDWDGMGCSVFVFVRPGRISFPGFGLWISTVCLVAQSHQRASWTEIDFFCACHVLKFLLSLASVIVDQRIATIWLWPCQTVG